MRPKLLKSPWLSNFRVPRRPFHASCRRQPTPPTGAKVSDHCVQIASMRLRCFRAVTTGNNASVFSNDGDGIKGLDLVGPGLHLCRSP